MTTRNQTDANAKGETAKARPKLLMVLGMHRSGTSAITKGLEVLGVDLGENLMPAHDHNPKGYFEDLELVELNERVLNKTGHFWYDLAPINPDLMKGPDFVTERLDAAAFIRRKLSASDTIGLKDPRLSILMPFWLDVLQDIEVETGYIIPVRNPLAVAHSVMLRDGISLERGAALWGRYICDALKATQSENRIFIDFDKLLDAPVLEVERLARTFGFKMPVANSKALKSYTDDFLESMLRNQNVSRKELERTGHTADIVIDLYNKLGDLASLPALDDGVSSNRAVNTLLKRMDGVTPLGRAVDRADHALKQIETRLHEVQMAHDSAVEQRDEAQARAEEFSDLADSFRAANEEAIAGREHYERAHEEAIRSRDSLQVAHDLACEQRDGLVQEVAVLERDVETLQAERKVQDAKERSLLAIMRHEADTSEHLRKSLAEAHDLIRQYRSSTSWKMTAPLRGCIRFATGTSPKNEGKLPKPPPARRGFSPFLLKFVSGRKMNAKQLPPPALPAEHKASGGRPSARGRAQIGVIIHAFYPELLPEILDRLRFAEVALKLYVTASAENLAAVHGLLNDQELPYELIQTENRGRDIGPFLSAMRWVNEDRPDYVLKLHTKRSTHLRNGENWRAHLYESLIGLDGPQRAVERFEMSPETGMLGPDGHILSTREFAGRNSEMMRSLAQRFGISASDLADSGFVAGSMFYVRHELVSDLTDQVISPSEFATEQGQTDGTLAHAVERIFGALVLARGYKVASLGDFIQQPAPLRRGAYQFV